MIMGPSNSTNTASFPVASSLPAQANQGSFPVANIIFLAISIIGMSTLVVRVFLQHRSSAKTKQSSSEVNKDEPRSIKRLWFRVLSSFSKAHLWLSKTRSATKHKQGEMATVDASHATCTFVTAAPSKILAPPVVMQFRVPDTEKFVVLCSVCCPLSAHHACGDPKSWVQNNFAGILHLAQEQLPVNNQPSSIPARQPYSVGIPSSNQDCSPSIELPDPSFEDQPSIAFCSTKRAKEDVCPRRSPGKDSQKMTC
ncbi:hypothetical protein BDR07DRAFT_1611315 [Suillus spraguei]|nr:hypothetical protein BDR07DRAFT_1611315 [Suillus spraguei]